MSYPPESKMEGAYSNKWTILNQTVDKSFKCPKKASSQCTVQNTAYGCQLSFHLNTDLSHPALGGEWRLSDQGFKVVQNKAACCVTKASWFTATRQLLRQCGWMSIRQLAFYHTVLTMYKILKSGRPLYLRKKLSRVFPYPTRQATGGHVRFSPDSVVEGSFISRGTKWYNSIPDDLKSISSLPTFKKKLKMWTVSNIPME